MTKRPKLEVTSWIASIVSALLAGIAIYLSPPAKPNDSPVPAKLIAQELKPQAEPVANSAPISVPPIDPRPSIPPPPTRSEVRDKGLQTALESALAIHDSKARDKGLLAVFSAALSRRSLQIGLDAASGIQNKQLQVEMLSKLACYSIARGIESRHDRTDQSDAEMARKAASVVIDPLLRDQILSVVAREAAIEWYKRNAEVDCGKP